MSVPSPLLSVLRAATDTLGEEAGRQYYYILHINITDDKVKKKNRKKRSVPGERLFVLREPKPENTTDNQK